MVTVYLYIGAKEFSNDKVGGSALSVSAFNPAVIQWHLRDDKIEFINLKALQPGIGPFPVIDIWISHAQMSLAPADAYFTFVSVVLMFIQMTISQPLLIFLI